MNIPFDYGFPIYYILMAGAAVFTAALFFILKNRSGRTKSAAIAVMAFFNLFIHLFKLYIFPHYTPSAENAYMCTAYTTCALIIITSPFIHVGKSGVLKDFMFVVGGVAGVFALIFPYSVISFSVAGKLSVWEIVRYYLNHYIIIATSVLPVALGVHKLSYRNFLKVPLIFLLYHIVVFANDCVLICAGYMGDYDSSTLYEGLLYWNPSRSVALTDTSAIVLGALKSVINSLTPEIFLKNIDGESFLWPVLYYTPALSLGLLLIEVVEYLLGDFFGIKADFLRLVSKIKSLFAGKGDSAEEENGVKESKISARPYLPPSYGGKTAYSRRAEVLRFTPTEQNGRQTEEKGEKKNARTIVFIRPR